MKRLTICIALLSMLITGCKQFKNEQKPQEEIAKATGAEVKLTSNLLTPETLWYFVRVGNVTVSHDGKKIAYTVTRYSIDENKGSADIFIMDADGGNKKQLTATPETEGALQWRSDNQYLGFLRHGQVMEIKPDGTGERQVTGLKDLEVSGFMYAPTGDKLLLTIETKLENTTGADIYKDMPKSDVHITDDLMYHHWDSWEDGFYSHIYLAGYADGKLTEAPVDIMLGEPYDSPLKPFGGMEEIAWSPDGKTVAYTCKKLKGKTYTMTTNSGIYLYSLDTKQTKLLTESMNGYDKHPLFSPDGQKLLWLSMEREGYEADKERIFIYNFATNTMNDYSKEFDANPSSLQWEPNGKSVLLTACFNETFRVFRMTLPETLEGNGTFTQLSKDGNFDYQNVQQAEGGLVITHTTFTQPTEIYKLNVNGEGTELSFVNKALLDQLNLPAFEQRMVKTTDSKQMPVWVFYPPNFDKNKQYPALMMCTGGPQGEVSPAYSFRWNYGLMASNGYVVIYPARRGVSGYGQTWTDGVCRDHGGQPERDLLAAIDNIAAEPWVDKSRLGACGASYGGFSVFWLAGNHNKRFKAFLAHAGIFDFQSMYATTEEMFFENWEKGGPFWDKNNATVQRVFKQSPINFVDKWDTPILVSHGEKDYRVPYTQGIEAYNIAQMRGIPSKLVIYPEENHWILRPQNAIVWQREFFAWFDKYLKGEQAEK